MLYRKLKSVMHYHHTKVESAAIRAITLLNLYCNIAVRQASTKVLLKEKCYLMSVKHVPNRLSFVTTLGSSSRTVK